MAVIMHCDVPHEPFTGGATYQTLVGDKQGTTPLRLGLQSSPPGYKTRLHSHPYLEVLTVVSGTGEAWMEGHEGMIPLAEGVTLAILPDVRHWFRALGSVPLKIYGIHASPHRIVNVHDET